MKDIFNAIAALILAAALLLFARATFAGEWFPEAAIYADLTPDNPPTYCYRDNGHAAHLGARVDLYSHGPHTVRTLWVHNSCAEEQDDRSSRDVLGIGYEYQLW